MRSLLLSTVTAQPASVPVLPKRWTQRSTPVGVYLAMKMSSPPALLSTRPSKSTLDWKEPVTTTLLVRSTATALGVTLSEEPAPPTIVSHTNPPPLVQLGVVALAAVLWADSLLALSTAVTV